MSENIDDKIIKVAFNELFTKNYFDITILKKIMKLYGISFDEKFMNKIELLHGIDYCKMDAKILPFLQESILPYFGLTLSEIGILSSTPIFKGEREDERV